MGLPFSQGLRKFRRLVKGHLGLAPVWDSTRYKGMHFLLLLRYRRFPLPLATAWYPVDRYRRSYTNYHRVRRPCASISPLMPSPGRPKMTSTPQSQRASIKTSAAVVATAISHPSRLGCCSPAQNTFFDGVISRFHAKRPFHGPLTR